MADGRGGHHCLLSCNGELFLSLDRPKKMQTKNKTNTCLAAKQVKFIYMLTHLVYSLALYGLGFDKRDDILIDYISLWNGLKNLLDKFAQWSAIELRDVDEIIGELFVTMYMFAHNADGSLSETFPFPNNLKPLEAQTIAMLNEQGLSRFRPFLFETDLRASTDPYTFIHRTMISMHLGGIKMIHKLQDTQTLKRKRATARQAPHATRITVVLFGAQAR